MNIGIVGVSGLVGQKIIESLYLIKPFFDTSIDKIFLYGSTSNDTVIEIFGLNHSITKFDNSFLHILNYCILAVDNPVAKEIVDYATKQNVECIIIDNSSEFRLDTSVPLIIPEINMSDYVDQKIIANPNCSTTILLMALYPLTKLGEIKKVILSTYQASSGAGKIGLSELEKQTCDYSRGEKLTTTFWKKQYIHNVFSHNSEIDESSLYNKEELKIINETKKILHNDKIIIDPTCVRVPVLQSHCISFHVEFKEKQSIYDVFDVFENFSGLKIENDIENNEFPEPIKTSNKSDVMVGRIRHYPNDMRMWNFFVSGDQLLKGAAYNSVQILECILMNKKF